MLGTLNGEGINLNPVDQIKDLTCKSEEFLIIYL